MNYPRDVLSLPRLQEIPSSPDCTCEHCVSRCKVMPGWFIPGEPTKVMEFLGLSSLRELYEKHLMLEYWYDRYKYGTMYVLSPARVGSEGRLARFGDAFGSFRCTFLNEQDRCIIHPVKPFECRIASCGKGRPVRPKDTHKSVAWAWLRYPAEIKLIGG